MSVLLLPVVRSGSGSLLLVQEMKAMFPHCDERVLHAPSECIYCDEFPVEQAHRIAQGINFTGHNEPGLKPCPADAARGLGWAHVWYGNAPKAKREPA